MGTFLKCGSSFKKKFTLGRIFFLLPFIALVSNAAPLGHLMTYEGVLTDSNGTPITQPQPVKFQIIYANSCVLYEETQSISPGPQGEFSVVIGTAPNRSDTTGNTADRIFSSQGTINCNDGSTQTVSGFDGRTLHINVNGTDLGPDITITTVPTAINSQKLADKDPSDFVQIDAARNVSQTSVNDFFGHNNFGFITDILNGVYNAPSATNATTATTAVNVSGIVAVANGGTGAATPADARTNLGLGSLASMSPSGTADATTYLRGDGTWQAVAGAVSSVAGKTGAVTLAATDISDFNTTTDGRIDSKKGIANGVASLDGNGKVPSTQLSLVAADIPNLDSGKITTGTFGDSFLTGLSIYKLINVTGKYLNYKPNNISCADNEVLKYDSTINSGEGGWKCAADNGVGAESDPTVQSFAKTPVSTGLGIDGSNQLFVKYGTTVGTAAEGSDSRITGAFQSSTSLSGDLSGTIINPKVEKIKGQAINSTGSATGQVLRYNTVTSGWEPSFVAMTDLRSKVTGSAAFPGTCGNNQTLTFDSVSDTMACSNISLTKSQISDFPALAASATTDTTNATNISSGTLAAGRMPALSGDVTSTLGTTSTMISNGVVTTSKIADGAVTSSKFDPGIGIWSTDGVNLFKMAGNVGIGTTTPTTKLDVSGVIRSSSGGVQFPDGTTMTTAASNSSTGDLNFAADTDFNFSGALIMSTNGLQRMRIENDGNIVAAKSVKAKSLILGSTSRSMSNGGTASSPSNEIIVRSFVTTDQTNGLVIFQTPEWRLERTGVSQEFRLVSTSTNFSSYWARSGTNYWSGDNPGSGNSITFDPGVSAKEFQVFFGYAYSGSGKFAHIVVNRYGADYFWVGYVTTNHDD